MRVPKKCCTHCRRWFQPDPRRAAVQTYCSRPECRRQSRLASHRKWWRDNGRELDVARANKHKTWARKTGYQSHYRADHPDYVLRDNVRRRRARQVVRRAVIQDISRQTSVGKLRDIQAFQPENAVNQDMIHRRVDGILDFLLWKEGAVIQDTTDPAALPA